MTEQHPLPTPRRRGEEDLRAQHENIVERLIARTKRVPSKQRKPIRRGRALEAGDMIEASTGTSGGGEGGAGVPTTQSSQLDQLETPYFIEALRYHMQSGLAVDGQKPPELELCLDAHPERVATALAWIKMLDVDELYVELLAE